MKIDINKRCYCDNNKIYSQCCEPLLLKKSQAKTALELMRSRFSAYVLKNGLYLYETCSKKLKNIDDIESINSQDIEWLGLKVLNFNDLEVSFMAYYKEEGVIQVLKEDSLFVIEDGAIKYDSGTMKDVEIGKNEKCPCGSGKKYKRCCL